MTAHLSYVEAVIVGAAQGVTELFPVSSLGHSVLVPALVGGQWAQDLNVSAPQSPYLAFIVGLHVATAAALLVFFWRDWLRILAGFISSVRYRRIQTSDERLAWLIVLATIPVGLAGLALEQLFRTTLGKPIPAAAFLLLNGIALYAGEVLRRRVAPAQDDPAPADEQPAHTGEAVDNRLAATAYRPGRADRLRPNPGPAPRYQPLRHHYRGRPMARPVARRRRPLLLLAGDAHHPGRRGYTKSRICSGRWEPASAARSWPAASPPSSAPTSPCATSPGTSKPAPSHRSPSTAPWSAPPAWPGSPCADRRPAQAIRQARL